MDERKEMLRGIVSKESVIDDLGILESYSWDESFTHPLKPSFLVQPKNVEMVQGIVKWANQTGTPLIPVSSGPPHFHGDTVPSVKGSVIVDLSKMNRIVRIDRRNRICLIEPGVNYSQLQPELMKEGLRLTTPLLPRANKSVIASLLERQPTLVPKYNWSLLEPLRCLEVVLGSGETMWTGEAGSHPHSLEKQWKMGLAQAEPKGPGETDWYRLVSGAQGSIGIITWASIKCEISPKVHELFFIPAQKLEDLIDCAYRLLRMRLGDEFLLLNSSNLAYLLGEGADTVKILKEKLPPWVIIIGVAGRDILPEKRVEVQVKDIRDITQQFNLEIMSTIPGTTSKQVLDILLRPSQGLYWKLGYKGGGQDIFFLTTLNKITEFIRTVNALAEAFKYPSSDIGIYIQPQHQGVTCHCEFHLPFDPDNKVEAAMIKQLFIKISEELVKQGAYFSRPYGIWAKMIYDRNEQSTILLKNIKQILDPNLILNPGKLCF